MASADDRPNGGSMTPGDDLSRERRIREHLAAIGRALSSGEVDPDRTAAWLAGELPGPLVKETPVNDLQMSIRMPWSAKVRAEALVPVLEKLPQYRGFHLRRAAVVRAALLRGLDVLEAEHAEYRSKHR